MFVHITCSISFYPQQLYDADTTQLRKLRLQEIKKLAQGQTTTKSGGPGCSATVTPNSLNFERNSLLWLFISLYFYLYKHLLNTNQ